MQKIIVSDTSCLILFYKIGEFELLHKVFGQIIITETIFKEFNRPIPDWIHVLNPSTNLHIGLKSFLDAGEASAISLASEFKDSILIIDELKGRKIAKELGLKITGSIGVLLTAKNKGIISLIKPLLEKIRETNFRLSDELIKTTLFHANEI